MVDQATWLQAQEQLKQNAIHSSRNNKKNQYLLRSLIRCPRCGSTYTGAVQHGHRRYRCSRTDASVSSTGKKCSPGSISADLVEQAVWGAIKEALQRPEALVEEYQRQLAQAGMPDALEGERKRAALALKRVKAQADRVTDAYINEAMDLDRYKAEMEKVKGRSQELERAATEIELRVHQEADSRAALRHLEQFCGRVSEGLESLSFDGRQQLLRLVVERITLDADRVCIQTVIPNEGNSVQLRTHHPGLVEGRSSRNIRVLR